MSHENIEVGSFAAPESRAQLDVFRVVSWNINRGYCFDQIVDFLASTNADLILLQECDVNAVRTGRRNIAREIAQTLQMNYAFGTEFIELSQGQSALHGQATFARTELSNPRVLRFAHQSNFWQPRWFLPNLSPLQRRLGGRMALVSETSLDQKDVVLYNIHLESRSADGLRIRQTHDISEDSRRYGPNVPVIVAGDFNCDVTQDALSTVIHNGQFRNPFAEKRLKPTTVSRKLGPTRVIDCILHRAVLGSYSPTVHASIPGSDHFPLSLTLRLS